MSLGYHRPDDLQVTLSTIMQDIIDDKSVDVAQGILHHNEGVDLLPSNIELSGLEVRLINAISRESVLKTCISEVRKNYDYVLVDCMPSLGMLTINALAAADSVVIPTQPHSPIGTDTIGTKPLILREYRKKPSISKKGENGSLSERSI